MVEAEGKRVVKSIVKDNGAEVWRRLMRKFNPQTQAVRSRRLREINNYGLKHAHTDIGGVVATLAEHEELIYKYVTDFGENPILHDQKRDTLKLILPREIERSFSLNTLGRDSAYELYDALKEAAEESIEEYDSYKVTGRKAGVAATWEVNAVAKSKGKGGGGLGGGHNSTPFPCKGAQQPPGSCRICWKFGNFARDCEWNDKRDASTGAETEKKDRPKGGKGNGRKGKGKVKA